MIANRLPLDFGGQEPYKSGSEKKLRLKNNCNEVKSDAQSDLVRRKAPAPCNLVPEIQLRIAFRLRGHNGPAERRCVMHAVSCPPVSGVDAPAPKVDRPAVRLMPVEYPTSAESDRQIDRICLELIVFYGKQLGTRDWLVNRELLEKRMWSLRGIHGNRVSESLDRLVECRRVRWSSSKSSVIVGRPRNASSLDGRCIYCGVGRKLMTTDHVIPRSVGGSNELSNLAHACTTCNQVKSDRTPQLWAADTLRPLSRWRRFCFGLRLVLLGGAA